MSTNRIENPESNITKPSRMQTNMSENIDKDFGTSNPRHIEPCSSGSYASFYLKPQEVDSNPKVNFPGFTTVSAKQIPVSPESVSKNMRIFESATVSEDDLKKMGNWMGDNHETDKVNSSSVVNFNPFNGFTTANGNHIRVASQSLLKNTNIFNNVNVTDDEIKEMDIYIDEECRNDGTMYEQENPKPEFAGIGALTGNISDKRNNNRYLPSDEPHSRFNPNSMHRGFATARGTHIPVSSALMLKNSRIFDSVNVTTGDLMNVNNWMFDDWNLGERSNNTENACSTDGTREVPISRSSFNTSIHNVENKSSSDLFRETTNTHKQKMSVSNSLCEYAAAIMEDDEMTFANRSVQLKDHSPGFASGFMAEVTASSTPISKNHNYRSRLKQTRLVEKFEEDYADSNATSIIKVNVSPHIKSLRVAALEEQRLSTTKTTNVEAVPSALFVNKRVNKLTSTQVNWKELVKYTRPVNKPIMHTSLTENILNVTTINATKFKFNGWDHYSDEFCQENVDGIRLLDDIVVMMDGNCQIGLNEIAIAFQCCPSVDVKLMHDKWIENHMKWIVVKLAAMERSFPQRFAGKVLTLENLMLQLRYRYERDIDRAERSAIRKICEMDDVPEKRMILYVAGINKIGSECEVQLSDGWYNIPSILDFGMRRLVDEERIKIGTKLVIYGASTVNLSAACHPLDLSTNVKLKIHANSTRRARWDAKLGYCKHPGPFNVRLKSVWGNGGNIPKLRICVLRVYPLVYIDPKNLTDVHSEKVEKRRSIIEEREQSRMFESLFSQVSREVEEEEQSSRYMDRPRKIIKLAELSFITDPAYLCELLDNDKDPESVESKLSNTQKSMVLDYMAKRNCLRGEKINTIVQEKLAAADKGFRKFVPLLRFKATDATFYDQTTVITVWKPSEETVSLVREETVFDLTGSSARGANLSELQIYAGIRANFQKIDVVTRVPTPLLRHHISISDIIAVEHVALNELDTIGVVADVGESFMGFQPVHITDISLNIIRINFWQSVKEFAYEEVLQPKRFVAFKNLQWRNSSNSRPIPTVYVTECTEVFENPQSTDLSSALNRLRDQFANVDMNAFIEKCMKIVRSLNASSWRSSLLQSSASSTPLPLSRSSMTN